MTDFGRDELIDARRERGHLADGITSIVNAVEKLMEDRVRHLEALRQIASMTETGIVPKGGYELHRIAKRAIDPDSVPPEFWEPGCNAGPGQR